MKTPSQILKEGLEEFDSMFDLADQIKQQEIDRWKLMYGFVPEDIKSFLTTHTLNILKAERERLAGMMKDMNVQFEDKDMAFGKGRVEDYRFGYNEAIDDQIHHLDEEIKKIKELM